ncbi:MAG TPA: hypothetical protein DCP91_05605 [Eggerthellaceae bacterium]|nr:hypothetical protein [Eggerthellaceae bacterium]
MRLLVHACCGPCSIMPTRLLAEEGHEISVFYANSNIAPAAEYEKRLRELESYAAAQGFEVVEGEYDPAAWEREVAPIGEAIRDYSPALSARHVGGAPAQDQAHATPQSVAELLDDERRRERCRACYRLRLQEAAAYAADNGFEGLATTLAVSPYQFTDIIGQETQRACEQAGIAALVRDFRPYYDEATRISRELGMYRQNYCGCRFSVQEGQATRDFVKQQRAQAKAAKAAASAGRRQAEDAARRQHAAEKRAYADERARRRAILKQLRQEDKQHGDR